MGNNGHSERNLFGGFTHYDGNGNKIGRSEPGIFGGFTNYDEHGHKTGHSDPGIFGGYSHYDEHGHKTGHSDPGIFGGYNHYDEHGHKSGHSDPGLFGNYVNYGDGNIGGNNYPDLSEGQKHNEGCYIATCVYGSYDSPPVMTLRKYRDNVLRKNILGRLFVRAYYAVSPTVVELFGDSKHFRKFWKRLLDKKVRRLLQSGKTD